MIPVKRRVILSGAAGRGVAKLSGLERARRVQEK